MGRSHGHGDAASVQAAIERGDELNACKDTTGCSVGRPADTAFPRALFLQASVIISVRRYARITLTARSATRAVQMLQTAQGSSESLGKGTGKGEKADRMENHIHFTGKEHPKCLMTQKSLLPANDVLALDEKLPTGNVASGKQDATRAGAEESLVG